MKKKYIIEVDESEIIEYWSKQGVKEIGYQEYALKSCPNIKVKPYEEIPKGKWVKSKDGYTRCDQCGSRGSAIKARFCHHCGADMRGKEE